LISELPFIPIILLPLAPKRDNLSPFPLIIELVFGLFLSSLSPNGEVRGSFLD
jgi:hypothetical protein